MSTEPTPPIDETFEPPVLNLRERRVLGVLVEKAKTTPDSYPLSLNSLTNGCNQKSNRDPVLNLDEMDVEETLEELKKKGLVIRITGSGRIERWRHNLYDTWMVGKVDLAILAELLLRGGQSIGELRGRANRMEDIADVDMLREHLHKLAERNMIVWLSPPNQRGAKVTHGFQPPVELERLKQFQSSEPPPPSSSVPRAADIAPTTSLNEDRMTKLENDLSQANIDIGTLRTQVAELQSTVATLSQEVQNLKDALGG